MTERWIIKDGEIVDTETNMTFDSFMEIVIVLNGQSRHLNELYKDKEELKYNVKRAINLRIDYKKQVAETLQKYYDKYTEMAVELREDKYANGMCHDVMEMICELAYDLGVKLE